MLFIGENLELKYLRIKDKFELGKFLNKKMFTVSDTPLSYRQVNTLDKDKLLTDNRKKKEGWRKFSFLELVYVLIVDELKKFGLNHQQLNQLWEYFIGKPIIGETAVGCTFTETEIILTVNSKGDVVFYEPSYFLVIKDSFEPFIYIRLNDIVNKLLVKMDKKSLPIRWSIRDAYMERKVSPKEMELVNIVRNKSYDSIRIKKKDGDISIIYAGKKMGKNTLSEQEVIKLLKEKDYQDVNIIKRDGKIVNYKVEETIKL